MRRRKDRLRARLERNFLRSFPLYSPDQRLNDPILEAIIAPTTTAMVDLRYPHRGSWKVDARYNALSLRRRRLRVDQASNEPRKGSVRRPALNRSPPHPKLRVLIVHGWNDLSCPFMGSILTVNQMPVMGDPTRVAVKEYPGGHMFYTRPTSRDELKKDVTAMYAAH